MAIPSPLYAIYSPHPTLSSSHRIVHYALSIRSFLPLAPYPALTLLLFLSLSLCPCPQRVLFIRASASDHPLPPVVLFIHHACTHPRTRRTALLRLFIRHITLLPLWIRTAGRFLHYLSLPVP